MCCEVREHIEPHAGPPEAAADGFAGQPRGGNARRRAPPSAARRADPPRRCVGPGVRPRGDARRRPRLGIGRDRVPHHPARPPDFTDAHRAKIGIVSLGGAPVPTEVAEQPRTSASPLSVRTAAPSTRRSRQPDRPAAAQADDHRGHRLRWCRAALVDDDGVDVVRTARRDPLPRPRPQRRLHRPGAHQRDGGRALVVGHRRHRPVGRRGLPADHRPPQGPDHPRGTNISPAEVEQLLAGWQVSPRSPSSDPRPPGSANAAAP